jgi:hypothetical protein
VKHLYQLTEDFKVLEVMETDAELDAESQEAVRNTLDGLKLDINAKAAGVAAYILNLEAQAASAEEAGKALINRAKRIEHRADSMRSYLHFQMQAVKLKKVDTELFTISRRENPPAVDIVPGTKLPAAYLMPRPQLIQILAAIAQAAGLHLDAIEDMTAPITLDLCELETVIGGCLPAPAPDKKKISDALKAWHKVADPLIDAHRIVLMNTGGTQSPPDELPPIPPNPLPGCSLTRSERLEIRD